MKLLKDWKHWVGWALTTASIVGLLFVLGVEGVHNSPLNIALIGAVIVVIDLIKHKVGLQ